MGDILFVSTVDLKEPHLGNDSTWAVPRRNVQAEIYAFNKEDVSLDYGREVRAPLLCTYLCCLFWTLTSHGLYLPPSSLFDLSDSVSPLKHE